MELRKNARRFCHGLDNTMFDEAHFQQDHLELKQVVTDNMNKQILDDRKQTSKFLQVYDDDALPNQTHNPRERRGTRSILFKPDRDSNGKVDVEADLYLFEGGSTTGAPLWGQKLSRSIDMGDGRGNPPAPAAHLLPQAIDRFCTEALAGLPERDPLANAGN